MGNRSGGGFPGMMLGSTSMRTQAEACCPVIVARGEADDSHDRIVAAVDIDIDIDCATILDFAFDEASRLGAGRTVTHAHSQQDPGIADEGRRRDCAVRRRTPPRTPSRADVTGIEREREHRLATLVRAAQARHPEVRSFHQTAVGSAAGLLVEASRRADLLVTGARRHREGRHGMLIGPVTQTLLRHAGCPVAVVPQD